jgi:hypothetical protein
MATRRKTRKKVTRKGKRVIMLFNNHKAMFSPSTGDPFMKSLSEAKKLQAFWREHAPQNDYTIISASREHAEKHRPWPKEWDNNPIDPQKD